MQFKNKLKKLNIKTITIDTPCSVTDIESFLHIVSHEGHWHDSIIIGKKNKIVIQYQED